MSNTNYNPTVVNEYFAWLEQTINKDAELYKSAHNYMDNQREIYKTQSKKDGPFLSVVMRTQGNRIPALREALLCLSSQTNTDFEVLIMGHNLNDSSKSAVEEEISECPDWLQNKIRLLEVTGGTRTTPLDAGFANAKGLYVSIFDDDDLVFDNWVEAFYELYKENQGLILHAYAVGQNWCTVKCEGEPAYAATSSFNNMFCKDFDLIHQFTVNSCPTMSLAFPVYAYQKLGIKFDASLTTTEDWDFLMRTARICGVADTHTVTSIYRLWDNLQNSQTVHRKKEWDENYKAITERLRHNPVVLLSDSIQSLITAQRGNIINAINICDVELFYDDGNGFSESCRIDAMKSSEDDWSIIFQEFPETNQIKALRIDPYITGSIMLDEFKLRVALKNGENRDYTLKDFKNNGKILGDKIVFLKNDPQMILEFEDTVSVRAVLMNCNIQMPISDEIIDELMDNHSLPYRALRKLWHILKGKR